MEGIFVCAVCASEKSLARLELLAGCECMICISCLERYAARHWQEQLVKVQALVPDTPAGQDFSKGDYVWYLTQHGHYVEAAIAAVDNTVSPRSYTVSFAADPSTYRETEAIRLRPATALQDGQFDTLGSANHASMERMGIIGCPNCGALIERLPPSDQSGMPESLAGQNSLSQEAAAHQAIHRFRCAACKQDFCGQCNVTPYHSGLTCEQQRAPKCLYCQTPLLDDAQLDTATASSSQLRHAIKAQRVSCSWCLEKKEFIKLYQRLQQVCKGEECQGKLQQGCMKQLICGHWCGGVASESTCLPCLHGCRSIVADSSVDNQRAVSLDGKDACPMCWEALLTGPAIMLSCGHLCHLECAREHLRQGYPGPAISFNFLSCPSCGDGAGRRQGNVQISSAAPPMQHPALIESLKRPLGLREQTVRRAKQRLKIEGLHTDPVLQPGGFFDGRPADFALTKLLFFECHKCSRPYYGGQRQCGADGAPDAEGNPANVSDRKELTCGACSAHEAGSSCRQHGNEFTEWKCRWCCGIASFFCFGTTHMCTACHERWQKQPGCLRASKRTCTPETCPLHTSHPDHGLEHCLGCALCRTND